MPKPTIINAQTTDYVQKSPTSTGLVRTYENVLIPSAANTVIMMVNSSSSETLVEIVSINYGNANAVKIHDIDVSPPTNLTPCRVVVFDVSAVNSDITADVTMTFSNNDSSRSTRLGVICTTGFVESWTAYTDDNMTDAQPQMYSPNYANNIMVLSGSLGRDVQDLTVTKGTLLYSGSPGIALAAVFGISQDSEESDNSKEMAFTMSAEEHNAVLFQISSQKKQFAAQKRIVKRAYL
jgi:hypothetical protein